MTLITKKYMYEYNNTDRTLSNGNLYKSVL